MFDCGRCIVAGIALGPGPRGVSGSEGQTSKGKQADVLIILFVIPVTSVKRSGSVVWPDEVL